MRPFTFDELMARDSLQGHTRECERCRGASGILQMCETGGGLYHDMLVAIGTAQNVDPFEAFISVRIWRGRRRPNE